MKKLVQAGDIIIYSIKGLAHSNYIDFIRELKEPRTLKTELRVGIYSLEQVEIKKILPKEKVENGFYKMEG